LQNAQWIYAINSGAHANPTYAGDTVYAYTEVLETIEHKRQDIGLLRLRTVAVKNQSSAEIESPKGDDGKYLKNVVLDLDYTVVIPTRIAAG
jgi:2-methylfumaryl-CoA hydratase